MHFVELCLFYLVIGGGVGVAYAAASRTESRWSQVFQSLTAVLFWPLYLPFLLDRGRPAESNPVSSPATAPDELSLAIQQVEAELDTALGSLEGWAEGVVGSERIRIDELKAAWQLQASRIRDMDRLLAAEACHVDRELNVPLSDRVRQSQVARRQNIERLQQIRNQAHQELTATLAWVRELVSMIHLARFTGALPSRTQELVAQIAAAIEGLSEVSRWQKEDADGHCPPVEGQNSHTPAA